MKIDFFSDTKPLLKKITMTINFYYYYEKTSFAYNPIIFYYYHYEKYITFFANVK